MRKLTFSLIVVAILFIAGCGLFTPDSETGVTPFYEGVRAGYDAAAAKIKDDPTPFAGAGDLLDYLLVFVTGGAGAGYLAYRRGQTVERKRNGNGNGGAAIR